MRRAQMSISLLLILLLTGYVGSWAAETKSGISDAREEPDISSRLPQTKEGSKDGVSKVESSERAVSKPDASKPKEESPPATRIYEPVPYPYIYVYPYMYPYPYVLPPLPRQTPLIYEWDREKDAVLRWDEYTQRFKWEGIVPPKQYETKIFTGPPESASPAVKEAERTAHPSVLTGEVVSVRISEGKSRITLRIEGKETTYAVADDTLIVRSVGGGRGTEITLGEIRPGDQVKISFGVDGKVNSIRAIQKVITGTVMAVAKGTVLLDSGETFKVTEETQVLLPGKIKGKASDIESGDRIRAEVGPISNQAFLVEIQPAGASEDSESQSTKSASGEH